MRGADDEQAKGFDEEQAKGFDDEHAKVCFVFNKIWEVYFVGPGLLTKMIYCACD